MRWPLAGLLGTWLATSTDGFASPSAQVAEGAPPAPAVASPPRARPPVEVRAGLSLRAQEQLHGRRLLRLLEIELDERTPLAERSVGPLGGDFIQLWIDTPSVDVALVEVRRTGRKVARRRLAIGEFPPDIATRVVAIAASEMVADQARRRAPRRTPKPAPGPVRPAASGEGWAGTATTAAIAALWLPASSPSGVAGPELGLAHRRGPTGQLLYARWLGNATAEHQLRWFEVGAGADLRLVLPAPDWRLHLGARAGGVALNLPGAVSTGGDADGTAAWSARGGALVGIETRWPAAGWIELSVEPGALLRAVDAADRGGETWSVGGFVMGLCLGLHVEAGAATARPQRQKRSPEPQPRP